MKKRLKKVVILAALSLVLCLTLGVTLISYFNTIKPRGIVIHHSAIPFLQNEYSPDVKTIDEIHKRKGYGIFYWGKTYHVGYHYIILPDGTLQQGRPEKSRGAHTSGYNDYIGICLIGDFSFKNETDWKTDQRPTNEQMQTLTVIVKDLQLKYDLPPDKVKTHKELNSETTCPGENFPGDNFFEQIKKF